MPKANSRLKAIVEERGIKLRELGKLIGGMAESTVGNIVNCKTNTTVGTLTKIAKALKVPPGDIVAGAETGPFAVPSASSQPRSPLEIRIYSIKLQLRQLLDGFDAFEPGQQLEAADAIAKLAAELGQKLKERHKPHDGHPPDPPPNH